jgi:protein N-lysine methyltransferase METTL21D
MADVTYNTSSFPSLLRTLSNLIVFSHSKGTTPAILLGYKQRDAAERTLWDLAKDIGVDFIKLGERKGAGGAPIEMWFGNVSAGEDMDPHNV